MTLEEIIDLGVEEYKKEKQKGNKPEDKSWLDGFTHGFLLGIKKVVDELKGVVK